MAEQLSFNLVLPSESLIQLWTPDEIYDRLNEANLHQFVEDKRVERKSIQVQPKTLAEYLSMWSNTQPHGGIIIVGVENNGRVTGCAKMAPEHKNNLESLTRLCEDARWASKEVPVKNALGKNDYVLVYRVSYRPDKVVETSAGEAFIREGDNKIRVSEILKR